MNQGDKEIRVVELFAGVGGFRIGLEGASDVFKTIWNNQWEPSTVKQDASIVYRTRFGSQGHCNRDINTGEEPVSTCSIPTATPPSGASLIPEGSEFFAIQNS